MSKRKKKRFKLSNKIREARVIWDAGNFIIPSPEDIRKARTAKGGWTAATLASWGIRWPPPDGWRKKLENQWYERHRGPAFESRPVMPVYKTVARDEIRHTESGPITVRVVTTELQKAQDSAKDGPSLRDSEDSQPETRRLPAKVPSLFD